MNVLFLTASYPTPEAPAPGIFVREHARAAAAAGHRVGVVHLQRTDVRGIHVRPDPDEAFPTVHVSYPRRPHLLSYFANVAAALAGWRALRARGFTPELVHAHFFLAAVPAVLLRPLHRLPVVVSEHWSVFLDDDPATLDPIVRRAAKFAFEHADAVLPVSAALGEGIRAAGIETRYRVVPNTFDASLFHPPDSSTKAQDGAVRVLTVGGLYEAKGYEYLLEAIAILARQRTDFRLDIVGDGPERPRYEALRVELGLESLVTFLGWQEKETIAELMRSADVYILASRYDNNPCAVIEALGSGLPVVATAVGGVPELVDDSVGRLAEARRPQSLAHELDGLLDDRTRFDRDRIAARARERYGLESVGRQLDSVYTAVSGARRRSA